MLALQMCFFACVVGSCSPDDHCALRCTISLKMFDVGMWGACLTATSSVVHQPSQRCCSVHTSQGCMTWTDLQCWPARQAFCFNTCHVSPPKGKHTNLLKSHSNAHTGSLRVNLGSGAWHSTQMAFALVARYVMGLNGHQPFSCCVPIMSAPTAPSLLGNSSDLGDVLACTVSIAHLYHACTTC